MTLANWERNDGACQSICFQVTVANFSHDLFWIIQTFCWGDKANNLSQQLHQPTNQKHLFHYHQLANKQSDWHQSAHQQTFICFSSTLTCLSAIFIWLSNNINQQVSCPSTININQPDSKPGFFTPNNLTILIEQS